MKRAVIIMAFLAVAAVAGAVIYQAEARERDYRLLLAQGDAALAGGQTSAAVEDYSGAIALRPDSMLAHLRRGETYRQRGDLDAAARDFRSASSLDPTAPRPLEQWGDVLYEQQRYRRAAEIYGSRLDLDDRSPVTHFRQGLAYYRDHNPTAALASLGRTLVLDERFADAYYLSGLCWRELNDPARATAALKKAIETAPASLAAREELADLYHESGQRSAELEQLQALAGLDGTHVERRIAVGLAHARAGHTELAILTLAGALEQFPDKTQLYGAIGRVWLDVAQAHPERTDALGKALEALERAAAAATANSDVKLWYGQALVLDHQIEAAERVLQQATERFPANPEAFADYAEIAERQHHPAAARTALLAYHALVGEDAGFPARALKIGRLSLEVNDAATAVRWLHRAIAADPQSANVATALADAEMRLGHLGVR